MNSWFVCELQCKFGDASLAFGIKDVVVIHHMKGRMKQEPSVLFKEDLENGNLISPNVGI
jgi:hypothetical protein